VPKPVASVLIRGKVNEKKFLKEVSYAHEGYNYLMKNTVKQ